ncbi:hypothetical protein ACE38V_19005 [Cytobacillus sp. Hz8]|uniref:DUF6946 family protein n=1 Tax=Cytobacillus sp. Hz8 TaxID=3347168 RepID=UPI0035DEDDF4
MEKAFEQSQIPLFKDVELLYGFHEYKVSLPRESSCSQNDFYIIAKANNKLLSIIYRRKSFGAIRDIKHVTLSLRKL